MFQNADGAVYAEHVIYPVVFFCAGSFIKFIGKCHKEFLFDERKKRYRTVL